jgi:hypothetical protein
MEGFDGGLYGGEGAEAEVADGFGFGWAGRDCSHLPAALSYLSSE